MAGDMAEEVIKEIERAQKEWACPICNRVMDDLNVEGKFADPGRAAECRYCYKMFVAIRFMGKMYWQEIFDYKEKKI